MKKKISRRDHYYSDKNGQLFFALKIEKTLEFTASVARDSHSKTAQLMGTRFLEFL